MQHAAAGSVKQRMRIEPPALQKSVWPALAALRSDELPREPLHWWSRRAASKARVALTALPRLQSMIGENYRSGAAIHHYYGLHPGHAFAAHPVSWVRLIEAQATAALARFLDDGGPQHILAFLRALAPRAAWPAELESASALAEVLTEKSSRIDLLLHGVADGIFYGAAIEAKFGASLKANPLPDYVDHVDALARANSLGAPSGEIRFFVIGPGKTRSVREGLESNARWEFLAWPMLLRRFEKNISGLDDNEDFRQCRRTIWDRTK